MAQDKQKKVARAYCVIVFISIVVVAVIGASISSFSGPGTGEVVTAFTNSSVDVDMISLPSGCAVFCGNERLAGYPTSLPEANGCNVTIRVENCSSVCLTLAAEVDVQHTWLGCFIMFILLFWPMYSMGKPKKGAQQYLTAVTVFAGFFNASIMSWRLIGRAATAMSEDGTCLWPNPYQEGGVLLVNRSRLFVWMITAASPAMATIIKNGLAVPITYWMSFQGMLGTRTESTYVVLVCLACAPAIVMLASTYVGATIALIFGLPLIGLFLVNGILQYSSIFLVMAISKVYHKKFTKPEDYPISLMSKEEMSAIFDQAKGWSSGLLYAYYLGVQGGVVTLLFGPLVQNGLFLFTLPLLGDGIAGAPSAYSNNAPTGAAYAQFFSGFTVPPFVWLDLKGQFETIEFQLALAIVIDLVLILEQHILPICGENSKILGGALGCSQKADKTEMAQTL